MSLQFKQKEDALAKRRIEVTTLHEVQTSPYFSTDAPTATSNSNVSLVDRSTRTQAGFGSVCRQRSSIQHRFERERRRDRQACRRSGR